MKEAAARKKTGTAKGLHRDVEARAVACAVAYATSPPDQQAVLWRMWSGVGPTVLDTDTTSAARSELIRDAARMIERFRNAPAGALASIVLAWIDGPNDMRVRSALVRRIETHRRSKPNHPTTDDLLRWGLVAAGVNNIKARDWVRATDRPAAKHSSKAARAL